MEGHPDVISPCVSNAQNTDFPLDPFKTVRELAFLQVQLPSEQTLDDTKPDLEGDERYQPTMGADQSLFILEEDDQLLELSKLRSSSEKSDILILNKQMNGFQNGHTNVKPSNRVRCYTGTIDHLYCMLHGSKYCCRAPEPKLVDHRTIDEDFFDDCLNYLECSEIMRDYVKGMWQHVLLGNEPVFLLESDQDDETNVSPDCLNECDRPLSGVTSANEGSNNTLSIDALTSLCVSHSQPLDAKRDFPGDSLKALQPEMVITVGHQEDNTSSLKRKERCKLPLSAIQDERAGIDEESMENSLRGDVSACIKPRTSNPYMELYLVNVLDHSVEGLITMTENSTGDPLIDDFSKERGTLYQSDAEGPGISEPTEECEADQHFRKDKPNITSDDKFLQDEDLTQEEPSSGQVESSLIVIEDMDTEGPMNTEEEHTHLIHFLKENIRPPEGCVHLAEKSLKTEVNEETQQLEETKICLSESEDVVKYTSDISEGNEATKALVSSEYCPENGNVGFRSQTVNGGLETTDTILEIEDSEHAVTNNGSQIVQTFDDDEQIPENKLQLAEILKNRSHCESQIVENESQLVDSGPQIIDDASQPELNRSKIDCGSQSGDEASQILDIVSKTLIFGAQIVNCASLFEDVGAPAVIFGAHIIDDGSPEEDVTLEIMDIGPQTVVLESQFLENCNFSKKKDDSTDNPQESEILQIIGSPHLVDPTRNSVIGHPLTGENELDLDKMFVLNDPTTHRSPKEQSNDLILENNKTVEDIKGACGFTGDQNALGHKVKDEINIIKEANQQSSARNFIKGDCEMSNHMSKENYQGDVVKRPLGGCVQKAKSLVKTMAGKDNNKTEMKKVHSLHVKDYIPNSNELSQVHRDPHTIRAGGGGGGGEGGVGGGSGQAHTSTLDQTNRGVSCSTQLMGSTNLLEKSTENKMVKKKFKSSGKEPIKDSNKEAETLDVNEVFKPDEEKRLKRVNSTEGTVAKDSKKAPQLLHGVQAELFHDRSGNLKLFCRFGEIHSDCTITWMKDAKLLARLHRSFKDNSPVSLAIVQVSKKDQGLYNCTLKNAHGKVSTEFHLTAEVLDRLTHSQDVEGGEEIEFNQLFFREDFITDMYFGGNLHGRITTEDLHFGEGVHRKAFRSKVMCGLFPVFNPGHLCVLKVHNAIAYGAKNSDELVQKNYKLAVQECYVQNTAREYAKVYASEAEQLEEFGKVPEIIPIFLIHRPANNIPYATVEEELIGDFVKYSIKDGKEINVLRKDSEAGQKCCTFQHWVYERTNGNLLVTDMQGVGMKLTDVGIATMGKGYKGFKGNCSVSFIDQFKALHQCNKYCEILGLQSLRPNPSKQKKPNPVKEKPQPNPASSRKSRQSTKAKKT